MLILPHSFRIYPHLQDTGGFFIAILQRKPPAKAPATASASRYVNSPLTQRASLDSSCRQRKQAECGHCRRSGKV